MSTTGSSTPEEPLTSTDSSMSQEPLTHFPSLTSSGSSSDMTLHYPPAGVHAEQKAAKTEELTLKSIQHIAQLPIVQEGSSMYFRLKEWNCLCKLYLNTAEWALRKAVLPVAPLQRFLHTPIHKVDDITLKGLEYVEGKFPAITLTSQQMLENMNKNIDTLKEYSASKVRDVIEVSLRSLPDSLVPDNVHIDGHISCTQSAMTHAQKVAAAPVGIDTDSSKLSDVGETDLVPKTVQASDLVPKSVQASDLVPKSVQASDLVPKSVQAATTIKN